MKVIIDRFLIKIKYKENNLYYLYNGTKINYELTFNEQANIIDKNRKHREWRCDNVLRKPKLGGRRDQQSVQAKLWKSSSFLFSLSDI